MNDNVVPKYKQYKSLDHLKERLREVIPYIEESDARYRVGYVLGSISFLNKMSKMGHPGRIKSVYEIGGKEYVFPSDEVIDKESIERELRSQRGLSSYGYGRLMRTIVVLASLYSDIYHLPFIDPVPLEVAFRELLSVRKKRYTMARNVLRCYEDTSHSSRYSSVRECALREMDRVLRDYVGIIGEHRIKDMEKRFIEAL